MKIKKYKIPEVNHLVLLPEPVFYNEKEVISSISVIEELNFQDNPIQIAALNILKKRDYWEKIRNPLGQLIFTVFNEETPDQFDFRMTVRQDLQDKAYELYLGTVEDVDKFLFASNTELEPEEAIRECLRIAAKITNANDDDELRDILIGELLYEAMSFHDDWPPP
jgi:hypothetical protein